MKPGGKSFFSSCFSSCFFSSLYLSFSTIFTALLVALVLLASMPNMASAHGKRTVGKYQFLIGFLAEPTFQGQQSGIDLRVCDGECKTDPVSSKTLNPIKDVDKTLQAEIINGKDRLPVKLSAVFGKEGSYSAVFFPTKAGDYSFRFSGTINGDSIDETFTSGKDGFNSVLKSEQVQFPEKLPSPTDLQQQLKEAKDSASSATLFGIGSGVIGLLGLALAIVALAIKGRSATVEVQSESEKEEEILSKFR